MDKFDDAPNSEPYFALWGKHEFDMESQRNILLHFLNDKKLNDLFMKYLDKEFPLDEDGYRERKKNVRKIQ